MSKRGSALLALTIVAGILVIGGVFWYLKNFAPPPNSTVLSTPSSGNGVTSQSWQTYKDGALTFEFGYPSNWNIFISSTTNEEDIILSPLAIDQAAIIPPSPALSLNYLVTDNQLHSEFFTPNPGGYTVAPLKIDRYDGSFYATTSTVASPQGTWFTETLGAYVQRGNRSGLTLRFNRHSTSSDFSIPDDMALFRTIVATVKFGTKISGLTDAASQNNDKQKYNIFTFGLANDLLFYYAEHKQFPDSLTALTDIINQPAINVSTNTAFDNLGSRTMSHLNDFSYSVSPDHQSYHLGVSMQTTLVVDDGSDSEFNSAAAGWVNGFNGTNAKPCRPSDTGIWCYDLVYSARGAAPLLGPSSAAPRSQLPSVTSVGVATTCDSICITSPRDGSTISPGSTLKVTVTTSPKQSVSAVTLMTQIGSSAILTKPPYAFSLSVPADIQPGTYSITAVARDSSQAMVYSPQITVVYSR